jgi:hypothetical protein
MAPPIKDVATQMTQVAIRGTRIITQGNAISTIIDFDTPTGDLADLQYAVQENGYVWVKAPGYKLIKIPPEYVNLPTKTVSKEGIVYLKANSVTE